MKHSAFRLVPERAISSAVCVSPKIGVPHSHNVLDTRYMSSDVQDGDGTDPGNESGSKKGGGSDQDGKPVCPRCKQPFSVDTLSTISEFSCPGVSIVTTHILLYMQLQLASSDVTTATISSYSWQTVIMRPSRVRISRTRSKISFIPKTCLLPERQVALYNCGHMYPLATNVSTFNVYYKYSEHLDADT